MRVKRVLVKKYGPLNNGKWDIDPSIEVAILCGPHGAGKSTFMRSIGHCMSRIFTLDFGVLPYYDYKEEYNIEIELNPISVEDKNLLGDERVFICPSYHTLNRKRDMVLGDKVPFGAVYPNTFSPPEYFSGTKHLLHHPKDESVDLFWIRGNGPINNPILIFAKALDYLGDDVSRDKILQTVNFQLLKAINLELVIKNGCLYCKRPKESSILNADYLSEAEYYAIGLLVFGLVLIPPSGILIIDSPETYLNPVAQYNIISSIISRLIDEQVIIATHSPSLIASRPIQEIYVLESNNDIQTPKKVDNETSVKIIQNLYGKEVYNSIISKISDYSSSSILTYLLQCSVKPGVIFRPQGDPQIQQLASWIMGYMQKSPNKRIKIIDIGAGNGDLLTSIYASGCCDRIKYIPIEQDEKKWEKIIQRAKQIQFLKFVTPMKNIFDLDRADIIFFINTLHELDFITRAELLSNALRLINKNGVVVIHEVLVLPIGEANFVMWNDEDIKEIFKNSNIKIDIIVANTFTQPSGWPLQTICLKTIDNLPTTEILVNGAINSLQSMLIRWSRKLKEGYSDSIKEELKGKVKAFLMAQVANLCVLLQEYQKNIRDNKSNLL